MKRTFSIMAFLTIFLILGSCSKDSENEDKKNGTSIHPPKWIQGVWLNKIFDEFDDSGYRFTKDDCYVITNGYENGLVIKDNGSGIIEYKEKINDNMYIIESIIKSNIKLGQERYVFRFKKISDNEIVYFPSITGVNPLLKQHLYRYNE